MGGSGMAPNHIVSGRLMNSSLCKLTNGDLKLFWHRVWTGKPCLWFCSTPEAAIWALGQKKIQQNHGFPLSVTQVMIWNLKFGYCKPWFAAVLKSNRGDLIERELLGLLFVEVAHLTCWKETLGILWPFSQLFPQDAWPERLVEESYQTFPCFYFLFRGRAVIWRWVNVLVFTSCTHGHSRRRMTKPLVTDCCVT